MKIKTCPSPNFDERTLPISMLVFHYTGMESGDAAFERLCDPEAKVSAHYMIDEDGHILRLVDEDKRAWHAGVAEWGGISDVNSASVGIEIVNGGHDFGLPDFTDVQINAVIALSKDIVKRYDLAPQNIVGHSDVAPDRKQDPGEKFPWKSLFAAGLGLWPDDVSDDDRILFEPGQRDRGVAVLQRGLAHIGYGVRVTGLMDETTGFAVSAVQRRWRPSRINGVVDMQTLDIVRQLAERV